jgi:hypothetical protein
MAKPLFLRIPEQVHQNLLTKKPKCLSLSTFCTLLLEQAVDTSATLAERTEGSEASTSSSCIIKEELFNKEDNSFLKQECKAVSSKKGAKSKRLRPDYSEEFLIFWNEYQRAPLKANAQSKNKAFEVWKQVIREESPVRLVEAAARAVEQMKQAKMQDEWCAPLPDAFRWLRDERYSVYLEDHVPAGPRMVGGILVYD